MKQPFITLAIIISCFLFSFTPAKAQVECFFIEGDPHVFIIESVSYDVKKKIDGSIDGSYSYKINGIFDGKPSSRSASSIPKGIALTQKSDNLQNYWFLKNLLSLRSISSIDSLYTVRADAEYDANRYIRFLSKNDLLFDDPYLESYLYSIVSKLMPNKRADGFPYDIKVVIAEDPSINAAIFPNGYLLVNTGLLAAVHTEDELAFALAHEVAHFMANHFLENIRAKKRAQNRAEFWAAFATAVSAVGEVTLAATTGYNTNGDLTRTTALLSAAIAEDVLSRMGLSFSREQEEAADEMARNAMRYLGYDDNAGASFFQRMADTYYEEGNWAAYYLVGDHPSLKKRIESCGTPNLKRDPAFEKTVSFAVTNAAIAKFNKGRFTQASKLVDQNITNSVGTHDDYIIKALCTLNLYNDVEHNNEALSLVQKALEIDSRYFNTIRAEIMVYLRVHDYAKASSRLHDYIEKLKGLIDSESDRHSSYFERLQNEYDWAKRMEIKVLGLNR